MVGALILAAGAGRRIGKGPKALLIDDGVTFLEKCVLACRQGGCGPIRVVVRPDESELLALAEGLADLVVLNPDPERGMFSSVQCGLRDAGLDSTKGFVVHPVDHPRVRSSTVARIASEVQGDTWVIPRFEGRPGHPVGLGSELIEQLSGLPDWFTLREALLQIAAKRVHVEVDDPGILENVNTL